MHIRLIIVGDQGPIWVQTVFKSYIQRLPPQWRFKCKIIKGEKQTKNRNSKSIIDLEGKKILAEVKKTEEIIILDESGAEFTSLELSEKLNISSKIRYLGFLKDVKPILKLSNLYVNASYFEGFPNSVVEAINHEIPVICSQSHGGINEILLNGKCGTIFKRPS